MRMTRRLLVLAFVISGCATLPPTTYHPLVKGSAAYEGYQDIQLDANTFKVVYWWNENTPEQRGQDLMLYRCAELTVERGFDYFVVVEDRGGARVIRLFHGARPNDKTDAFDAHDMMQAVGQRLGMQPGPTREATTP